MKLGKKFMALLVALSFSGTPVWALSPQEAATLPDRVLGKADAPITIIEYASLTCGHCAMFQDEVLPLLKEKYVETGKVKIIYRDFPIDGISMKVAAVARCMPEASYHPFVTLLFKNQGSWVHAEDPVKAVAQYARLGGLSPIDAEACGKNEKLMDAIADGRVKAEFDYKVAATPTFILNGGKDKIEGALPFDQFSAKLDQLLASLPKK